MHMLSCYQTTLPLYMVSTIFTLINLIYVIPLYLKFGLGLTIKAFGLLRPTFTERRTIMQMQNHAKNLFASRFNAQLPVFVSYHPDPEAVHINAF